MALIGSLGSGAGQSLVLHGDAGVGKTALLDFAARSARDCRVIRLTGLEAESNFAFAALHQLCVPLLDQLGGVPEPQRDALLITLGERTGPAPDRFLLGLSVLSLLAEAATNKPLLILVDDHHWLDRASASTLGFAARRLIADCVGLVFATRTPSSELLGLRHLKIDALRDADARTLLERALGGPLDPRVREQILAEARGNPLALLEIPRTLSAAELAGGFGLPGATSLPLNLDTSFQEQIGTLPRRTRMLLALVAAAPAGDPTMLWRAAELLGLDPKDAAPAADAAVAEFGSRIRFRHPLIRSAVYQVTQMADRRRIHAALASVIDVTRDPDRRAWHLGQAAAGPDEAIAVELEACAGRALSRGGVSAAAAFLERASALSTAPASRSQRAIAAASAWAQAGNLTTSADLLQVAEGTDLSSSQRAQIDITRAQLALMASRGNDAAPLLLSAARTLETIDAAAARSTYLEALSAAVFAGRLATDGGVLEVAASARAVCSDRGEPSTADLLLDGITAQHTYGFTAGLSTVARALKNFGVGGDPEKELQLMWLACIAAAHLWDSEALARLSHRHMQLARELGALSQLPLASSTQVFSWLFEGQFDSADAQIAEMAAATHAMGITITDYGALALAAMRGRHAELTALAEAATRDANARGEGITLTVTAWATAVLHNGLGNYQDALAASTYATAYPGDCTSSGWALVEIIEAASRTGELDTAHQALDRLTTMTTASGTDWGLGVEARSRALLSSGAGAEDRYRTAIRHLSRTNYRTETGRAHLLYGEWLRRHRRRSDAYSHLDRAFDIFSAIGMEAFAARTERELRAIGHRSQRRTATTPIQRLTAQEAQIARMARAGMSNPEIGARLFISSRTVQYHLKKVYAKLDIRSRGQLDGALPPDSDGH